ncbi:CopD family protein [Paenibacillus sp. FSL K6-3182]|uniref:copper resistance D family protein n=1 Tax=Paenibacillus sp. FSL K6-3182 TaxID=2921495 RepID=UPI0030CAACC7
MEKYLLQLKQMASGRWAKYMAMVLLFLLIAAAASLWVSPPQAFAQLHSGMEETNFDPHKQVGHDHSDGTHSEAGITVSQALFYTVRAIYYAAFMFAAGLMLWSITLSKDADSSLSKLVQKWSIYSLRGLLLAVLLFVFVHASQLMKGYDGGNSNEWVRLLTETSTGQSWLALIVLSLLGFTVLRMHDSLKMIWALLLIAVESFNGHVNALPSNTFAIVFDFIHIVCSALWAGGLMLLLLLWRTDRKEAGRFAERFTKVAWLTIVLLTISGIGMTALLLPSWRYLFYTSWGFMLLAKSGLVLIVACVGFLLHRRAKQQKLPNGKLLKLDGLLMALVLILASIFTYVSPVPDTEPLSYHKMGETLHYTVIITPNGPGPNDVKLKIWLPETLGSPASVQFLLRTPDNPKKADINVPVRGASGENYLAFPGFLETDYESDKFELPTRGAWEAELIITDQTGAVTKQLIPFRND